MTRPLHPATLASLALSLCASGAATACGSKEPPQASPRPAAAPARPLAGMAAQRIVVVPALAVREGDPAGWAARIPRLREFLRVLDEEIAAALSERGLGQAWVFPDQLWRGHSRNPSLGVDPYRLATQPLRGVRLAVGERVPQPLASQLRSLVAVHDARFVLVPVEVFFDIDRAAGTGRTALRLALVDARLAEIRWSSEVKAERPGIGPERAQLTDVATRLADLVAAP
ncbi:MAG: hypothetical protein M3303_05575 [Gemmatimonadota bacterium]|nr:hypothetical protein [Gemmatimonadota bacterium]